MRLLAALLLVDAAPPPPAGEWIVFFEHSEGGTSYYDSGSVERSGTVVRVWARWDRSGVKDAPFHDGRIRNEIDCAARTVRILRYTAYDAAGGIVVTGDAPLRTDAIRDGTVAWGLARALCPSGSVRI